MFNLFNTKKQEAATKEPAPDCFVTICKHFNYSGIPYCKDYVLASWHFAHYGSSISNVTFDPFESFNIVDVIKNMRCHVWNNAPKWDKEKSTSENMIIFSDYYNTAFQKDRTVFNEIIEAINSQNY